MRHIVWATLVAAAIGGCASANRIERGAAAHEAAAKRLEAEGNYREAAKEREASAKQYEKANSRRGFEDAMPIAFH